MNNQCLDRISGIVFTCIGAAVAYGSWVMPRFSERGASIYEAPGLTPGLLGVCLGLSGLVLALRRSGYAAQDHSFWESVAGSPANRKRALVALVLTLTYGAFLFGSVPYVLATSLFVFAFIAVFELFLRSPDDEALRPPTARVLSMAALVALATGFGTQYVFQSLFLVQLP
ncbi:MAG: tripartite tricarboxylate transporter TctB family protein [Roseibium sp.]